MPSAMTIYVAFDELDRACAIDRGQERIRAIRAKRALEPLLGDALIAEVQEHPAIATRRVRLPSGRVVEVQRFTNHD